MLRAHEPPITEHVFLYSIERGRPSRPSRPKLNKNGGFLIAARSSEVVRGRPFELGHLSSQATRLRARRTAGGTVIKGNHSRHKAAPRLGRRWSRSGRWPKGNFHLPIARSRLSPSQHSNRFRLSPAVHLAAAVSPRAFIDARSPLDDVPEFDPKGRGERKKQAAQICACYIAVLRTRRTRCRYVTPRITNLPAGHGPSSWC